MNSRLNLIVVIIAALAPVAAQAQSVVLDRDGSTIVFEPYAPNIIRVTLSMIKTAATSAARLRVRGAAFRAGVVPPG